ncbi:MAG TPA: 50S ribosomal protein L35 [Limnochordales bacterium]|nr:50S ribosomal protein L35 [Limnochordales bacterium]
MPKLKTHRGAAKRFKKTGTGKFVKNRAFRSHLLEHKSSRRKRRLRAPQLLHESEQRRVRLLLPYA